MTAPAIVSASNIMPVHSVLFNSDISDWFQSDDPFVIEAAKDRIFAAAKWDTRAGYMKRIIENFDAKPKVITDFDINAEHKRLRADHKNVAKPYDYYGPMTEHQERMRRLIPAEELTPSAWPNILEKALYV